MILGARIVTMGAIASLSGCSVADTSPAIGGRDSSSKVTTGSGGAGAGAGGTSNVTGGAGDFTGLAAGGAGSTGGDGTAGSGAQVIDAEAPPVCNVPQYTHVSTFGAIFDGWSVGTNSAPSLIAGIDGGSVVALDPTDGSPANGSVKLTIPFLYANQQLLFAQPWPASINLTGTTISARFKLDSGLNITPENPGQAFLVVKSTSSYFYAPAPPINLDSSVGWTTLTLDADAPSAAIPGGYTPCDIREIDVVVHTGEMGVYTQAVVHLDTIAVTSRTAADAGPDATTDAHD
jgi:hypothetical protein